MKNTATIATLAAGISQVAATGFGWHNAPSFNCPANTDNKCTPQQVPGFDWKDLPTGSFNNYGGFNWKGFTCENKFSKRDTLVPRHPKFQDKCISGVAHPDKNQAPNFACNGKDIEKTSIGGFQVTPEFDCDLEFHYGMPDGSTCKHRTPCKKSGTFVENTQCGGAKNVTVVVPKQPAVPKETCNFGFHSITFDCNKPSSTVPPKPKTTYPATSTKPSVPSVPTTEAGKPSASSSGSVLVSTPKASTPVVTSSSVVPQTSSVPVGSPSQSVPAESPSKSVPAESPSKSVPAESPSKSVPVPAESASTSVPAQSVSTTLSTYMTTSTIFSTSVSTVIGCGPEEGSNCPASSTQTTIVTKPIGTTVTAVTETKPVETKPVESAPATSQPGVPVPPPAPNTPASPSAQVPATSPQPGVPAVPTTPVDTLPCPAVVPSCLNTWMFSVGCKDNTDAACYCPDAKFVKAIYECMAAHGESQEVIADSIEYFKGICAPFVTTNPGIVTGPDSLTYITAKPTPVPSASYTTILVTATTAVPVTDEAGAEITGSTSTVTISTTMTVPQVAVTTVEVPGQSPAVGVVPGVPTYDAQPIPTGSGPAGPTGANEGAAPYPTTFVSAKPTGTGGLVPTPSASQTAIVTAGAARVGSGIAFGAFFAAVAAVL